VSVGWPGERRRQTGPVPQVELLTVGHGTLPADELAALLADNGVALLVDVRSYPGSRRHPHFGRAEMAAWVPEAGIAYRWEGRLGGRRPVRADSVNVALRNAAFRGYADHMTTPEFRQALDEVLADAGDRRTAVMCSESLWWRCHRRLLSDAATLVGGAAVTHMMHDRRTVPHPLTEGVRREGDHLVYDVGGTLPLPL
jgi:uncharacterized protein (DUF488 family)